MATNTNTPTKNSGSRFQLFKDRNLGSSAPGARELSQMPLKETPPSDAMANLSPMEREILDLASKRMPAPRRVETPFVLRTSGLTRASGSKSGVNQEASSDGMQAKGPWESETKFSDEQKEAINCAAPTVVVNAFAGTGKTTMAVGYAQRRPNSRVLYMPFGKTVQIEALKRFPPNTTCQTINSAAWVAAGPALRSKLTNSFTPILLREELNLHTSRQAGLVLKVLNNFMTTADHEFKTSHTKVITEEGNWNASGAEAADALTSARIAWRRMADSSDKMPVPHDALLKLWAIKRPKLDYDCIIFDEAQDTNAVTADIIARQVHATRLYVGDRHQSIYGFRGATNAMEVMSEDRGAVQLNLSQTWRFGPKVAEMANMILGELKGEKLKLIGMGKDGPWNKNSPYTKLARTNAQLFRDAAVRQGKGIHWAGPNGIKGYNVNRLNDAYNLFAAKPCADAVLGKFRSWGEAQDYAEASKDQEVRMLVQVVDEFRHDTPALVSDLVNNEEKDESRAAVIFATAHKAKGLDWDFVEMADDFSVLLKVEEKLAENPLNPLDEMTIQELNLLYVGFTRAKINLSINSETTEWLANIEKFRIARNLSMQKALGRQEASRSFFQRPAKQA